VNSLLRIPYSVAGRIADAFTAVVPAGESKFRRGLSARRGLIDRYRRWGDTSRDPSRPLAWFHAPSVGEGLQALPVIELLRARRRDVQIAFTFYSPSAERFAQSVKADFTDYLPFDRFDHANAVVEALRPSTLIFSKLDIWPALTESAAAHKVRVGVVSATLPESSGRRGIFARALLSDAYRALDRVGAIDDADAERLREQGVQRERIKVTGDTRYDQVWARANAQSDARVAIVDRFKSDRPTFVAGSTWPSDEKRLLPAWVHTRRQIASARLIIAPHEVSPAHVDAIVQWARQHSLTLSRTSEGGRGDTDVVLVDEYGLLGDIYAVADVTYVGGGFHDAGLHSLLEPAAFGAPVLIGPMHTDNRDAKLLIGGGGALRCNGAGDISARLLAWFRNESVRYKAGMCARRVVESGIGAAERSVELVESMFGTA